MSYYYQTAPLRENPWKIDRDESYTVKPLTAIERQRKYDGTPITSGNNTVLHPADTPVFITLEKGQPEQGPVNTDPSMSLDPDEVVKSYLRGIIVSCK